MRRFGEPALFAGDRERRQGQTGCFESAFGEGFAALDDALSNTFKITDPLSFVTTAIGTSSSLWGLFWDDSGAQNDDNHDDYIAIARFRPVGVPEPATISLLGIGLLGLAAAGRRRAPK